jgi:hypothetical protein
MPPDEPNDEERQQELPEDNETPFQPADPPREPGAEPDADAQPLSSFDTTHPSTDSSIDAMEAYDEGLESAAQADEPNHGNAVTGYDPDTATNSDAPV